MALCDVWANGGEGGKELGELVLEAIEKKHFNYKQNYKYNYYLRNKVNKEQIKMIHKSI